jgi:predicted DNA-binding transcriptional regulator AlpA
VPGHAKAPRHLGGCEALLLPAVQHCTLRHRMDQPATSSPKVRLLKAIDVATSLGISQRQLWRLRATGELPAPVRVGRRCIRWRVEDITRFIDRLKAAK